VRVEKLAGLSRSISTNREADEVLRHTRGVLGGLVALCVECREACAPDDLHCTLPALAALRDHATELLPVADDLVSERKHGQITGLAFASQVEALRRRVREIMPDPRSVAFADLAAAESDPARRAALASVAMRSSDELTRLGAMLSDQPALSPGFGGYQQGGVYMINPGDPMYDAVLQAPAAAHAVTSVEVRADGDTGVMVVQESPGQMRLYQLTNDPLTMMRNISLILDKVMQAAVKFGGG